MTSAKHSYLGHRIDALLLLASAGPVTALERPNSALRETERAAQHAASHFNVARVDTSPDEKVAVTEKKIL